MIFVTGGAGFIGSNFILNWFKKNSETVVNIDKLTYAGNLKNLDSISECKNYIFEKIDICSFEKMQKLFFKYKPRAILNFAAESHVDRSIYGPKDFIETNIGGTFNLLEVSKKYWLDLDVENKKNFRFLHVSTDEVYGSLELTDSPFNEENCYKPNSPYSASKASSDHLVRAYHHTYGLPTLTSNCSNNYGPFQFPEKLIPLVISNALALKDLPIYGDGLNIRDWLFVTDHCKALEVILSSGAPGETYNVGGCNEKKNIDVVNLICQILDQLKPRSDQKSYLSQKVFVNDRLGHDKRYAIDASKIEKKLGWRPNENFESGLLKTIHWYLENEDWLQELKIKDQE